MPKKNSALETPYDLSLNRHYDFVYAFPMIGILGLPVDDLETLKNIYDIIDPSSFYSQLPGALIQVKHSAIFTAIESEKPSAKLS